MTAAEDAVTRAGHVEPPRPVVLDAARDVLWVVVADAMLHAAPDAAPGRTPRRTRPGSRGSQAQESRGMDGLPPGPGDGPLPSV